MNLAANLDPVMVMRRRAMRRARGRRRLMLLACAGALIAVIGAYYAVRASPIFNVQTVTVTGGNPKLDAAVQATAESAAQGTSLLAVNTGAIGQSVDSMPYVRSVTVDRAFPNTLRLSVVMYHPAVAALVGAKTYLISDDAHVITTAKVAPSTIPAVNLPADTRFASGQDTSNVKLASALWLLRSTPTWFRHQFGGITAVTVTRAGTVTATVGRRMQLRLGTPDHLDLKMQAVALLLGRTSAHDRSVIRYVDVTAPGRPTIAFRTKNSKP